MNIIVLFIALAVISLFLVSYINTQQTRKRLIRQRLQQLKRKISEQEELSAAIGGLTGSVQIEHIVLDDILETLRGMQQLEPDDQSIAMSLANAVERIEEISSPGYHCTLYRLMPSDSAIAKAQFNISEAAKVVRKRQASGHLDTAHMTSHIEALTWAHMAVAVVSLIGHGHKAVLAGDVLRGYSYYKKAQETAINSPINDDRRQQFIKELSDILNNKKKSLSYELMPETEYNPDKSTS